MYSCVSWLAGRTYGRDGRTPASPGPTRVPVNQPTLLRVPAVCRGEGFAPSRRTRPRSSSPRLVSIPAMSVRTGGSAVSGTTRAWCAIAVVLACTGLLGACGSQTATTTTYLNTAHVAAAIQRSILSERHLTARVVCPAKVVQKPGTFPCIATTVAAKAPHKTIKTAFVVTIHNDSGYVTYVGK